MDFFKEVNLRNGETVTMRLTEEWDEITFWQGENQLSGEFEFKSDDDCYKRFLLSRMYSPMPRSGLGEEALRFFKEETTNASIWTRPDNGVRLDDQSHLTERAPDFVRKMQGLGLIEPWYGMGEHLDDWEYQE